MKKRFSRRVPLGVALIMLLCLLLLAWRALPHLPERSESPAGVSGNTATHRRGGALDSSGASRAKSVGATRIDRAERRRLLEQLKARQTERDDQRAEVSGAQSRSATAGASGDPPPRALPAPAAWTREYIQAKVRELVPLVQECYESVLHDQPTLHGRLTVRFVIEGEPGVGSIVSESEVLDDGLGENAEIETCVRETMYTLKFDPPQAGGKVTVEYPFVFEREDDQRQTAEPHP